MKISDGGGMLEERAEAGIEEVITQELCFGNPELTFAQTNHQAVTLHSSRMSLRC